MFIGDEAMLVFRAADDAVAATRIIVARSQNDGFPELRVGLHHGPLTWRGDDPFGSTVNLASRIASHAAGGQVLASIAVARALADGETTPLGEFVARGVTDPIQIVEVATAVTPSAIDPVCQMQLRAGTVQPPSSTEVHGGSCARWLVLAGSSVTLTSSSVSCAAHWPALPDGHTAAAPGERCRVARGSTTVCGVTLSTGNASLIIGEADSDAG